VKHRWYTPKGAPSLRLCRTCKAASYAVATDSECLVAQSDDPALNSLYKSRRFAAERADGSGSGAMRAWGELEQIERSLDALDPQGDWRWEGNHYDGEGWKVRRP